MERAAFGAKRSDARPARRRIGRSERERRRRGVRIRHPAGRKQARTPGHHRGRRDNGARMDPLGAQALALQRRHANHPSQGGAWFPPGVCRRPGRLGVTARACLRMADTTRLCGGRGRALRFSVGFAAGRAGFLRGLIAPSDGAPPLAGGRLGVSGRLDAVGPCPRPPFFRSEAAAVPPALLGGAAPAQMVFTGETLAMIFHGGSRQREAERGSRVGEQGEAGDEPAPERWP